MTMVPIGEVIINGEHVAPASATVRIDDIGLLRGYGCFEALRSYAGTPFRAAEHLARLEASAAAMWLPLPARDQLEGWVADRASIGDVIVRIVVTGGADLNALGSDASVIVFAHAVPPRPDSMRLTELIAPWHPGGEPSELAGVKALSYGPNTAAMLAARSRGFDDALLLDTATTVLELPMASVGWVLDGVIETPSLDLGILRSVTRHAMIEVAAEKAIHVEEGRFPSARLHAADEAFVMSTTKEIVPVVDVDGRHFEIGPVTTDLAAGLRELIRFETG